jgi:hypothetical protein
MKQYLALFMAVTLLLTSCATAEKPITTHLISNQTVAEHDEVVSSKGTIDYYPNSADPKEIVLKGTTQGQLIDITCLTAGCQTSKFKIVGSPLMPNGDYLTAKTDDPNITMVRDSSGDQTLGYLVSNDHSHAIKYVPTITDANSWEHKGDTARMAGKVALYTLLVVAVVGLVAAGAYAGARANEQANTVTTTCTNYGITTTCTSR